MNGTWRNAEQEQFIQTLKQSLDEGSFKRVTFSAKAKNADKFKASFDLVLGGSKKIIKHEASHLAAGETLAYEPIALIAMLQDQPYAGFRAATLFTQDKDFHYTENRKGEPKFYAAKATMRDVVQTHNKPKNYVLSEKRPYLRGLGVADHRGHIIKKYHPKFRQIANFVEIIDRDIGTFVETADHPISILDLGCGKGYLTFATYDYVAERARMQPIGQGIDIKENVIDLCNEIAGNVGFDGLKFINARIDKNQPQNVDILIALHACDTATDDALALGVRADMQYFFCAPCCQAEISRQIGNAGTTFDMVNQYPLMRRRQADLITDTARALMLTALGYEVKFLEFTPLEHTAKNVMLAGKKSDKVDRNKAWADYLELKKSSGFEKHALEENLRDLLG
ncbi:class I SAM-dependent methyltransferase [Ahrensia marina]|uniref:class I SAM-dependent methyltransferase n=1 Tax=Ahrensia marina TaxID=1514904 RepID=UPI0006B54C24|nr:SAM-dependent methyltransferase [Ahrensia marina]